ncbi:MAG: F0F1 ATP synthase subunit B [Lachnospiraceae bacterium]|nr:F0F1 ATP synthase subunit B [Lachnospiraceae bacterium]
MTLLAQGAEEEKLTQRLFGLDAQLLADACLTALNVFILFVLLSYLLFNPARALIKKRQDRVREEMETAAKDKADAMSLKAEYDEKLKNAEREVEDILSDGRKRAIKRENEIIAEAGEEAVRIRERAEREIALERDKMKDDVKKEIITVAAAMAGKVIASSIDEAGQEKLIEDALNEMGESTWQS